MDLKLSGDLMPSFREYLTTKPTEGLIDMTVTILTSTYWPLATVGQERAPLPLEVQSSCKIFEEFYALRHRGRKLTWLSDIGWMDLRANFPKRRRDVVCNIFQTCLCHEKRPQRGERCRCGHTTRQSLNAVSLSS
eukprot:Pompholyxophrys_punicea_v1_NODE_1636_length_611_cov_15.827338.p1 type:complete len:135 gc:universal NODE_1636_length_611_cov_15.827338:610-206(-)